jgi:hypothetical protein
MFTRSLDVLKMLHVQRIEKNYAKLSEYCVKDAKVADFVNVLTGPDSEIATALSDLICEIGFPLDKHSVSFTDNLNSFISNAFYDDTHWTVGHTKQNGLWKASTLDGPEGTVYAAQDPLVLIEAAKENAKFNKQTAEALDKGLGEWFHAMSSFKSESPLLEKFDSNVIQQEVTRYGQ